MSQTPNRLTNTWINGNMSFRDLSYYKKAISHTNIWKMDYHIARVFNTPAYCEVLLLDLHGQIETVELNKDTEIVKPVASTAASKSMFNLLLEDIFKEVSDNELSPEVEELFNKGFAWYLVAYQLISEVDLETLPVSMLDHIKILQNSMTATSKLLLFKELITLCGNRVLAEKSKALVLNIVSSVRGK